MRLNYIPFFLSLTLFACTEARAPDQTGSGGAKAGCDTRAFAEIGGPVSLLSSTGARVTEADFKGRASLVYFGFTYCPDICPMTLVTLNKALQSLPASIDPPLTLLISIDPERDTPDAMAEYISLDAFPDDIVGLTGTQEEIKAAADVFKSGYSRIDQPDSLAGYTMDHTSIIYLMDENWQLQTFFTHDATAGDIADCLAYHFG